MLRRRGLILAVSAAAFMAACGGGDAEPEAGEGHEESPQRSIEAPSATITIDGDQADWASIAGLDLTLEAIRGEDVEPRAATIKVAHDEETLYALFIVTDDFNWNPDDAHLSGAAAVMWSIGEGAGEHMGAEEPDRETSLGMVDIWHWELDCAAGAQSGGSVSGPGGEDPGNDGKCNLDDEWATIPEEREDDNGAGAENSLLGVWNHTSPTEDSSGEWIFELSRPLATEDDQDAQLAVGETALLALAYWDPDNGDTGWGDDQHAQSANQGWIEVALA